MAEAAGTSPIRLSHELTIFHDVAKALTSSLNLDSIQMCIRDSDKGGLWEPKGS